MNMVVDSICSALKTHLETQDNQVDIAGKPLRALPVASPEVIDQCEHALGFALPPLLKAIYLNVANGGFGPGYGIGSAMGLVDLYRFCMEPDPAEPRDEWCPTWLAFCDWGCNVHSVIACAQADYPVFFYDPLSLLDNEETSLASIYESSPKRPLAQWFEAWMAGTDFWQVGY